MAADHARSTLNRGVWTASAPFLKFTPGGPEDPGFELTQRGVRHTVGKGCRRALARLAAGSRRDVRQLAARTVFDGHRALLTFFRWAEAQGYRVDSRILALKRPRVPVKEPAVYHVAQVRQILAACNPKLPQEELAVRILAGSGIRESELCGLAVVALDGLPDLMLDSVARGCVELRVRWDGGAKGRKSRRVPITPKLGDAIKRYEARERPEVPYSELLINHLGMPNQALDMEILREVAKGNL